MLALNHHVKPLWKFSGSMVSYSSFVTPDAGQNTSRLRASTLTVAALVAASIRPMHVFPIARRMPGVYRVTKRSRN